MKMILVLLVLLFSNTVSAVERKHVLVNCKASIIDSIKGTTIHTSDMNYILGPNLPTDRVNLAKGILIEEVELAQGLNYEGQLLINVMTAIPKTNVNGDDYIERARHSFASGHKQVDLGAFVGSENLIVHCKTL